MNLPGKADRPDLGGDRDAWLLATLPRAVAYASSLLRDRGAAEDVVHDCYVRLLRKADTYDLPRDGTKLLFKAITNACIDRNGRGRVFSSLGFADGEAAPIADPRAWEPHNLASHRELEAAVADSLGRLGLAQRAALELKSLGYSLREIAEALEVSEGNAGVLVHRARKQMADDLARFREGRPDD